MPLTIQEFKQGLVYWDNATRWPADLHNAFYGQMALQNPNGGFDLNWWHGFSGHLRTWQATRGVSMQVLTRRAEEEFPALAATWKQCCTPSAQGDITNTPWDSVADWVAVVAKIKAVESPVFRAKFSHFLLPQVFPVVDWGVMRFPFGPSYRAHFEGVQNDWATTPADTRDELRAALLSRIGAPLAPSYPVINKIVEICLIGRRYS
jgi:hypothetical protein